MRYVTASDYDYAVSCRRQFHRHPELEFDLPRTVAAVCRELERLGIGWKEAGPAGVVGYLGPEDAPTVALRADMDALPIQETTGLPYASEIPGVMHACGHDSHMAVLLTAARILKRHEKALKVRIKLLFQPSEEGAQSGARSMVAHGVMEDVDRILAAHCDNELEVGTVGICPGGYMTASTLIRLRFVGKRAHAATPEKGVDAIAMAVEAHGALRQAVAEEAGDRLYIFGINVLSGGTAPNMVAEQCEMTIAFRYYEQALYDSFRKRCEAICRQIAARYGGSVEQHWHTSAPPVYNDPHLAEAFAAGLRDSECRVVQIPPARVSEDFSWYLQEKPGMLFRFGTGNKDLGCTQALHCGDFRIDERGMAYAAEAFVAYLLQAYKTSFDVCL